MLIGTVKLKTRNDVPRPRSDSRRRIIRSTRTLLRRHGYYGTGLAQIIEHSGAPRGSVYFLFPDGKEQIVTEAVLDWTVELAELIRSSHAASSTAEEWLGSMVDHFAKEFRDSGFTEGFPVTMITLDSVPSPSLKAACRSAYDTWLAALVEGLTAYGVDPGRADGLAKLMLASLEGAMVLCRVYQSVEPLQQIAPQVLALITAE
jgi:TetR/AcrR family transcriptional repressor of lmrAB and yxaGH operons